MRDSSMEAARPHNPCRRRNPLLSGSPAMTGLPVSAAGSRPMMSSALNFFPRGSHIRPGAIPLVPQQPAAAGQAPSTSGAAPSGQTPPRFGQDLMRPPMGNLTLPTSTAMAPMTNSVLNAAWLGSLQRGSLNTAGQLAPGAAPPQGTSLPGGGLTLPPGTLMSQQLPSPGLMQQSLQPQPTVSQVQHSYSPLTSACNGVSSFVISLALHGYLICKHALFSISFIVVEDHSRTADISLQQRQKNSLVQPLKCSKPHGRSTKDRLQQR